MGVTQDVRPETIAIDADLAVHYQELAAAILQRAVEDAKCPRHEPMAMCRKTYRRQSCTACRRRALRDLSSDWGYFLADEIGINPGYWALAVEELRRQVPPSRRDEVRETERQERIELGQKAGEGVIRR